MTIIEDEIVNDNGSFSNKTYCGLTVLFLKTKIYFYRCNFVNKQIKKKFLISIFRIDSSQYEELKIFWKMFVVLEIELLIYGHLLKMLPYNITN